MEISPIELEVVKNALVSIAEEMGVVLVRAAQSTNIKERRDCSSAIFDRQGVTIAQAEHVPMHLGSMLGIISAILERYPLDQIHPGDMFITNDPYSGGGTHLPDITVAAPVFFDGEIIAFVVNIAHHSDVGGRVAGSNSGDCTSIFEEGLRIPLVKVVEGGTIIDRVLAFITLNCRTPEERLADLQAQVAANRVGIQRLQELAAKLGKDFLTAACQALLAHAERKIREAVRQIPDGTYTFEDYMDDDGRGMVKIPIRVTITVQGDDIHLDFAGSGPQARGGINFVWPALQGMVYFSLKAILDPTIPSNGGFFRAVRISAPTGTIQCPPAGGHGRPLRHRPAGGGRHLRGPRPGHPGEGGGRLQRGRNGFHVLRLRPGYGTPLRVHRNPGRGDGGPSRSRWPGWSSGARHQHLQPPRGGPGERVPAHGGLHRADPGFGRKGEVPRRPGDTEGHPGGWPHRHVLDARRPTAPSTLGTVRRRAGEVRSVCDNPGGHGGAQGSPLGQDERDPAGRGGRGQRPDPRSGRMGASR